VEKIRCEAEEKCFEMMNSKNAYVVLTMIRLLSLLEQSRTGEHCPRDAIRIGAIGEAHGESFERRRKYLHQVLHQTMALLSHRSADARNEALELLRIYISSTGPPLDWLLLDSSCSCVPVICRH